MSDAKAITKNYDRVKKYLKKLNVEEIIEYRAKNAISMPLPITFPSGETILLAVTTIISSKWIQTKCLLVFKGDIPDFIFHAICVEMLKYNFIYNELTYSLDNEGNFFVEADMPSASDYDNFEAEYQSIIFGAEKFFYEIIPKIAFDIKRQSTYSREDPNLYYC